MKKIYMVCLLLLCMIILISCGQGIANSAATESKPATFSLPSPSLSPTAVPSPAVYAYRPILIANLSGNKEDILDASLLVLEKEGQFKGLTSGQYNGKSIEQLYEEGAFDDTYCTLENIHTPLWDAGTEFVFYTQDGKTFTAQVQTASCSFCEATACFNVHLRCKIKNLPQDATGYAIGLLPDINPDKIYSLEPNQQIAVDMDNDGQDDQIFYNTNGDTSGSRI